MKMLEFKGWLAKDKGIFKSQISLYRIKPTKHKSDADINYDSLPEEELVLNKFEAKGLKEGECKRVLITITEIE